LECGFELAGVARAEPLPEAGWYLEWVRRGMAGAMDYLADHRADLRRDPRSLLPSARSIICVGKLYNTAYPYSTEFTAPGRAWISRYGWGRDYHTVMRKGLRLLVRKLQKATAAGFDWRIAVDSAPLLERALARRAGLGWIGKNSCLIHQNGGSWFFLAELLVSLEIEPDAPPEDRCGSCTRCIDACPTGALVPTGLEGGPAFCVDSRRCVSYLTIELREEADPGLSQAAGRHLFGCDICQDVCPWNRKAGVTEDIAFQPRHFAPAAEWLESMSEPGFRAAFEGTPVRRAGWGGFRRNRAAVLEHFGRGRRS